VSVEDKATTIYWYINLILLGTLDAKLGEYEEELYIVIAGIIARVTRVDNLRFVNSTSDRISSLILKNKGKREANYVSYT